MVHTPGETFKVGVDWRRGEAVFRDHLLDADTQQNTGNWQWVAGTGLDAAPFDRVFNPVLQARKFDPQGEYIARWVPELRGLPARARHAPWEAGAAGLAATQGYPHPIVDLGESRNDALAAFARLKGR